MMLRSILSWLVLVGLMAGCISEGHGEGMHRVEIMTSYYPEPRYPENDEFGLPDDAPASGARLVMDVEGSPTDPECRSIRALSAGQEVHGADCMYEAHLGAAGSVWFVIPRDARFELELIVGGSTPEQPDGCAREYKSTLPGEAPFTRTVEQESQVVVPFFIYCWEGLD